MSSEPENLVLNLLRDIRGDTAAIRATQEEHGRRLTTLEFGLAGIRRDLGSDALDRADQGLRIDRIAARVEHIERRLELREDG